MGNSIVILILLIGLFWIIADDVAGKRYLTKIIKVGVPQKLW